MATKKKTTTAKSAAESEVAYPHIPIAKPTSGGYVGVHGNPERGDMLVDERRYVQLREDGEGPKRYIGRIERKSDKGFRAVVFDKPYTMEDLRHSRQRQDASIPPAFRASRSDAKFYIEHSWKSRHGGA